MSDQKSNSLAQSSTLSVSPTCSKPPAGSEIPTDTAESTPTPKLDTLEPKNSEETEPLEFGGQKGPEPTRYGDWEKNGRCTDF